MPEPKNSKSEIDTEAILEDAKSLLLKWLTDKPRTNEEIADRIIDFGSIAYDMGCTVVENEIADIFERLRGQ